MNCLIRRLKNKSYIIYRHKKQSRSKQSCNGGDSQCVKLSAVCLFSFIWFLKCSTVTINYSSNFLKKFKKRKEKIFTLLQCFQILFLAEMHLCPGKTKLTSVHNFKNLVPSRTELASWKDTMWPHSLTHKEGWNMPLKYRPPTLGTRKLVKASTIIASLLSKSLTRSITFWGQTEYVQ